MDIFHAVYISMKINIITECYLKVITEIVLNHFFILVMIIFFIGFGVTNRLRVSRGCFWEVKTYFTGKDTTFRKEISQPSEELHFGTWLHVDTEILVKKLPLSRACRNHYLDSDYT